MACRLVAVGLSARVGAVGLGRGLRPLVGRQHHDHVAAVELGRRLDLGQRATLLGDAVEDPLAQLGVG